MADEFKDIVTTVLSALTTVAAVTASLYQWRVSRIRSRLKDDLEILKRWGELPRVLPLQDDDRYVALRKNIDRMMFTAYERAGIHWGMVAIGVVVAAIGVFNLLAGSWLDLVMGIMCLVLGPVVTVNGLAHPLRMHGPHTPAPWHLPEHQETDAPAAVSRRPS